MAIEKFEYIQGPCKTTTPWYRPDPYNLELWYKELCGTIEDFSNYKLWLWGGALHNRETWDVDVIITGELTDIDLLENIMTEAVNIGYKNRLLIDICWCHDREPYLEKGKLCKKLQFACQEVMDKGKCSGLHCGDPLETEMSCIVLGRRIIKNGEVIKEHSSSTNVSGNLWMFNWDADGKTPVCAKEKFKVRLENTISDKTYPILLSVDTNFYFNFTINYGQLI